MLLIYYSTFQKIMNNEKKEVEVTRFEVINHADNDWPIGRILTMYKEMENFQEIEVSYQDGGRTIKIFLR